jgi:hypothetical protein
MAQEEHGSQEKKMAAPVMSADVHFLVDSPVFVRVVRRKTCFYPEERSRADGTSLL